MTSAQLLDLKVHALAVYCRHLANARRRDLRVGRRAVQRQAQYAATQHDTAGSRMLIWMDAFGNGYQAWIGYLNGEPLNTASIFEVAG